MDRWGTIEGRMGDMWEQLGVHWTGRGQVKDIGQVWDIGVNEFTNVSYDLKRLVGWTKVTFHPACPLRQYVKMIVYH